MRLRVTNGSGTALRKGLTKMSSFDISSFESRLAAKNEFDGNLRFGAKKFHSDTNRSGNGKPADGGLIREHAKVVEDLGAERFQRVGDFWEEVPFCPVCEESEAVYVHSRMALDIWRCASCNHRYQNPRLSFAKATELYADDKTAADIYTQPLQKNIDRIKYNYGLELIDHLEPPSRGRIMDLGCGAGVFLEVAHEKGWGMCVGIDANSRYSQTYREVPGLQYIQSSFENLDPSKLGKDYDCISLWNVLEHLYDLNAIVTELKKMLKPGGLLLVMVPNVESLATRLLREKSATFNWKHVGHFSPQSLELLMKKNGMDCVHMETAITEIDNIKSYMSGEYPYHGYGDPDGLFNFITPDFIHRNLLGSRILGLFRNA